MAGNNRVSEVLLRWEIDNAALKRVIDSNKRIEESLENVKGETAAAELTAKRLQVEFSQLNRMKSIDALARDFASVRLAGGNTVAEIERLTKALIDMGATEGEIKQVVNQISRLGDEAERAKASVVPEVESNVSTTAPQRQGSKFTRYGNALFNLPDVGPSTTIARLLQGAGAAQEALDASGKSFSDLALKAAPIAIAFAAVGAALVVVGRENERVASGIRALVAAQEEYFAVVATGTRDVVRDALVEAQNREKAAQLQADATRALFEEVQRQFDDTRTVGSGLGELFNLSGLRDLRTSLNEADAALMQSQFLIGFYTGALDENATALADAKARVVELTQEMTGRFLDGVNKGIDALQHLNDIAIKSRLNEAEAARQDFLLLQQIQDENSGQLQDRIHALILESDALRIAKAALESSGKVTEETTAQIHAYEAAILRNEAIYRIILGLLPGLFAAEAGLKKVNDELNTFVGEGIGRLATGLRDMRGFFDELSEGLKKHREELKRFGQASIDFRDAQKKRADAEKSLAEAQANAARAIDQAQQKINDVIRDGQQERARILSDADTKLSNLAYDHNIDRVDAEEDLIETLRRIRDDADLEQKNAVGARDALSHFLSKQQANKEENEEERQARKTEARRKRDYQRSLELLAQATSRELDIQRQRNEATLANARQALDIERQKHALEISERQRALQIAAEQYKNFLQLMQDIARSMGTRVIVPNTEFITPEEARRRLAGGAYGDSAAAPIPQDSIAGSTRSYAPQSAASAGGSGSMTIPIQINGIGLNRQQIIRQVDERLAETLAQEGYQ